MNLDIKRRIDTIAHPKAVRLFFNLIDQLITENNLSADDERLVLNVRNDSRKRFSVNINSRLVLYIKGGEEFGFMINKDDWHLFKNIPHIDKEVFGNYEPASFNVSFSLDEFLNNQELITNYWLKSCISYLPKQERSQYRKHHIEELYNIAKDSNLLDNYLSDSEQYYSKFKQVVYDFKDYIKSEDILIKDFEIQTVYDSYVWISDSKGIIGRDGFCHYELIVRNRKYPKKIWVELHFENVWRKKAKSFLTDQLPEGFFWNSDHGGTENSIAFENNIDFQDQDIFSKLEKALFQFEETFGEKVRNLVFRDVKKEFINWFVSREEKERKTYFSKQFNGNMERFESEIDSYENWYKTDFETDLFLINVTDAQNKYNEISTNVYSNSPSFSKNGKEKGSYRPTAILGKNNYLTFLKEYFKLNSDTLYTNKNTSIHMPLNQILYGPPGTGKTYNTINKALSILENKSEKEIDLESRSALKQRFESYIESGQVVFTTFHQSMSYEDFVEGIKPQAKNEQVTYSVEDGLFKSFVKKTLIEYLDKDDEVSESDDFDSIYNSYINSIKDFENKREGIFTTKTGVEIMLIDANENSILVKYLWSNKNKTEEGQHTFSVTKEKLKKVLLEGIEPDKVKSLKAELHPIVGHIHCELFAVYKSFYEFVIANKGEIETIYFNYEDQSYEEIKDQFDALDKQSLQNKNVKKYVLIIDEINRGNVSQIFGELITLIEESKRLDADESLEVKLPYSKKEFGVPSNLYIIGTMNTADRSVEALDTALRRRFTFEEMLPKPFLLKDKNIGTVNLEEVLTMINKRIEVLLDRDHTIGHSYFINVKNENDLRNTFKNNIIPLLQEYFYGDYEKIGMVLGMEFFEEFEKFDNSLFAKFQTENYPQGGRFFRLKTINQDFEIIKAIQILMNKKVEETNV